MQIIRWTFLILVGLILIILAVGNREPVTLRLLPDDLAHLAPAVPGPVMVPLFLVIFGGIIIGLLVGFFWEWLRERKHRQSAVARKREIARLETQVDDLKKKTSGDKDSILELLE